MTPLEVTEQFVAAINAHDVERLASLMTTDHRFIDSLGTVAEGRDTMREGWQFYFGMVADYALEISRSFAAKNGGAEIMLAGMASGSYWSEGEKRPNSSWRTPAALRAVVRDGRIAEWQVYADNEPIREQMRAASA
jgi:ketosteroid isomerase-like protein